VINAIDDVRSLLYLVAGGMTGVRNSKDSSGPRFGRGMGCLRGRRIRGTVRTDPDREPG